MPASSTPQELRRLANRLLTANKELHAENEDLRAEVPAKPRNWIGTELGQPVRIMNSFEAGVGFALGAGAVYIGARFLIWFVVAMASL